MVSNRKFGILKQENIINANHLRQQKIVVLSKDSGAKLPGFKLQL